MDVHFGTPSSGANSTGQTSDLLLQPMHQTQHGQQDDNRDCNYQEQSEWVSVHFGLAPIPTQSRWHPTHPLLWSPSLIITY